MSWGRTRQREKVTKLDGEVSGPKREGTPFSAVKIQAESVRTFGGLSSIEKRREGERMGKREILPRGTTVESYFNKKKRKFEVKRGGGLHQRAMQDSYGPLPYL